MKTKKKISERQKMLLSRRRRRDYAKRRAVEARMSHWTVRNMNKPLVTTELARALTSLSSSPARGVMALPLIPIARLEAWVRYGF